MASRQQEESLAEEAICPICLDFFTEPVLLECGHNFCRSCITQCWEEKETNSCPECREDFPERNIRINRALANLAEKARKMKVNLRAKESKLHCEEHEEELKLFCETDKELICLICRDSREHREHRFMPIKEAVGMYKEELQNLLKLILDKKKECDAVKSDNEKTLTHIQDQSVKTEKQITAEFEKLHQFLHEEERIVLEDLNLEKKKKSQEMKERIEKITEEISSLSVTVQDIEQELSEQDNIKFLSKIQDLQKRVKGTLPEPQKVYPLINMGKYIGPLQYRVWKKMLTVINTAPVTFDPNTAHPELLLSEDLRNVRDTGKRQQLPDNPERFDPYLDVLGSEGFTSGKHSWEVEVGNKTEWTVGVAKESINRKGETYLNPGDGYWTTFLREGNKYWAGEESWKLLELSVKPRKIRVCLDYEGGKVSFYNSDNKSHIYTFTATFTEKLYPYFSPENTDGGENTEPLKICPRTVTIQEDEGFIPSSK
ncbi:zinc-binding protein A33-like isoform X2 [Carcharodon carcharias]|uniref:zinc-binding protein A33-like isoform X2 n=1 Tax=Carcharodon carcharias TaxID=13397 RepID=UPI001B7E5B51|nr:zinc-binding protein A33-like isoform X2 [Carcharodon carcharias]